MWFDKYYRNRKSAIALTLLLALASVFALPLLKFSFSFEQFFPTGDKDLEFFQDFIEEFNTDDNFLLIALKNEGGIFEKSFLTKVNAFSEQCKEIEYVTDVQSLANLKMPRAGLMGIELRPLLNLNNASQLKQDSIKITQDERFVNNLIDNNAKSLVVALTTEDGIQINESKVIMQGVYSTLERHGFIDYHILGRAYFQTELSRLQFREIAISTIISGLLISIIMILIFRRWKSIFIALSSIGLALVIFMGLLAILGRQLSLMSALYPILMLIVGTSDVVHIMTKYMDELKAGASRKNALEITIKQIGLATLLTSLTTAVGFATLLSSRIIPIQAFGINSAMGVIIAFIVMITFTCPLMSLFDKSSLIYYRHSNKSWNGFLTWCYNTTKNKSKLISISFLSFIVLSIIGISKIHTNYELESNLPKGAKITEDFSFFEKHYAGFRPLEIAIFAMNNATVLDYDIIQSINKIENHIRSKEEIQTSVSIAMAIKSLNQALSFQNSNNYTLPDSSNYAGVQNLLSQYPVMGSDKLLSKDLKKTRISARIKDVGAERIKELSTDIDNWIIDNVKNENINIRQTGTGLILDKNSEFVRASLLNGLGMALVIVSVLMGLLFRKLKYLLIALIPNIVPLLFAAALIGFGNIPLESGTAIVFAIIFGIAVDDTIHFMSKYKLSLDKYKDHEKAMYITFTETGKAIVYTSIILFFGFLVMLFSSNQPSVIIGLLISITLISAVIADLLLLPLIIRKFDSNHK